MGSLDLGDGRELTLEQEAELFQTTRRSIVRLEQQSHYADELRDRHLPRWQAGDPIDPLSEPALVHWLLLMIELEDRGVEVTRVRVLDDPPTADQEWLRWLGHWNTAAGEEMRYLSRTQASDCGLLPAAGSDDWWLFDDTTLLSLHFDASGAFRSARATQDPRAVQPALRCWTTALANSTPLASEVTLPSKEQLTSLG